MNPALKPLLALASLITGMVVAGVVVTVVLPSLDMDASGGVKLFIFALVTGIIAVPEMIFILFVIGRNNSGGTGE